MKSEIKYYAKLDFPGLGEIKHRIQIKELKNDLEFPLVTSIVSIGLMKDIEEASHTNFMRYRFIRRSMYPCEWGFEEEKCADDESVRAKPYIKAWEVTYELGEII